MREPCPQSVFGGCDPSSCRRQCSSTNTAHERPSSFTDKSELAGFIFVGAVIALGFLAFIAAANEGLSRAEHAYQIERA